MTFDSCHKNLVSPNAPQPERVNQVRKLNLFKTEHTQSDEDGGTNHAKERGCKRNVKYS
jgi:hypothetical protein